MGLVQRYQDQELDSDVDLAAQSCQPVSSGVQLKLCTVVDHVPLEFKKLHLIDMSLTP